MGMKPRMWLTSHSSPPVLWPVTRTSTIAPSTRSDQSSTCTALLGSDSSYISSSGLNRCTTTCTMAPGCGGTSNCRIETMPCWRPPNSTNTSSRRIPTTRPLCSESGSNAGWSACDPPPISSSIEASPIARSARLPSRPRAAPEVRRRERRGGSGLRRHGRRRICLAPALAPGPLQRRKAEPRFLAARCTTAPRRYVPREASTAAYSAAAGSSISSPEATGEGTGEGDAGKTEGGTGRSRRLDQTSPLPSPLSPLPSVLRRFGFFSAFVHGLPIVAGSRPIGGRVALRTDQDSAALPLGVCAGRFATGLIGRWARRLRNLAGG